MSGSATNDVADTQVQAPTFEQPTTIPQASGPLADTELVDITDSANVLGAGPGGQCGATQESSAADLPPRIGTSDRPLHGPAAPTLQPDTVDVDEPDSGELHPAT